MLPILVYIVLGLILLMAPHFVLPIQMITGGRDAWLLADCSFWFHPESFIGMLLVCFGIGRFMSSRFAWPIGFLGVALFCQGLFLKPVSYYFHSEDNLIIIAQTISVRAHAHIKPFLLVLAVILILTAIFDVIKARRRHVKGLVSLWGLAISNIRRRSFRSVSLVLALSVVIGAFFADVLLTRSIGNTLSLGAGRLGADLVVVPKGYEKKAKDILMNGTPHVFDLPLKVYEGVRQLPEVEQSSPQVFFRPFSYLVCCTTEQVLVVGYDPKTDFTINPWVHYHLNHDQDIGEIVVGNQVKFYPGQSITMLGERIKVAASLDNTGIGYFDYSAFIPIDGARNLMRFLKKNEEQNKLRKRNDIKDLSLAHLFDKESAQEGQMARMNPDGISAIFVKVKDGVDIHEFAAKVEKIFPDAAVVNVKSATASIKKQLTSMLDAFILPIFILVGMGTGILAVVFSMSANERQREIGLLRAMGAKKSHIFRLFLSEFLTITMLGGIFGVLGGGAMLILFKNNIMAALNLLYIWPDLQTVFQVFVLTFLVAVLIGVGAGIYPSIKAANLEPYEAFRGK